MAEEACDLLARRDLVRQCSVSIVLRELVRSRTEISTADLYDHDYGIIRIDSAFCDHDSHGQLSQQERSDQTKFASRVTYCPWPCSETDCGLPPPVSVIDRLATAAPFTVGLNVSV